MSDTHNRLVTCISLDRENRLGNGMSVEPWVQVERRSAALTSSTACSDVMQSSSSSSVLGSSIIPFARYSFLAACVVVFGCDGPEPSTDGGVGPQTIDENIFAEPGEPVRDATAAQLEVFARGREIFNRTWTVEEGQGPLFSTTGCRTCHESPVVGGRASRYRDTYLVYRTFRDGSQDPLGTNGTQSHYRTTGSPRQPTAGEVTLWARRHAPHIVGTGALIRIAPNVIASNADPMDADGDGVSGRVNIEFGRIAFIGYKAQTSSVERMLRGQLYEHIGLTTEPLTPTERAMLPGNAPAAAEGDVGRTDAPQVRNPDVPTRDVDEVMDPELAPEALVDLVTWAMLLGIPEPDPHTPDTLAGEEVFEEVGCATCHIPTLAAPSGLIPLYSDLLLHDMGEDLGDGLRGVLVEPNEMRTPPLWFVGAGGPYLHDARADTIDEAIRFHGGEATRARDAYVALDSGTQGQLIAFLERFGGRYASPSPQFEVGELGGPREGVDTAEFEAAAVVFSRPLTDEQGLGPSFDGDACASCHQLGGMGGAGGRDVNVIWQGEDDGSRVTAPAAGLVLSKHTLGLVRPEPTGAVLVAAQPPSLFVAGLVSRVDVDALRALEDVDDSDGDGVSGRLADLGDGVFGLFGWKSSHGTLAAAIAGCAYSHMGLTVEDAGAEFGSDSDAVADPELSSDTMSQLGFLLDALAAPGGPTDDPGDVAAGREAFENIGCASCHVPSLAARGGGEVSLYSDLLLHDLSATGGEGIAVGAASETEYRTPWLRGYAVSVPYMHDGRAPTLDVVMSRHGGEASRSRDEWTALGADEQRQLEAFLRSL